MSATLSITKPTNATEPDKPDTRIATVLNKNLRLADYKDTGSYRFTSGNLDSLSWDRKFFEQKLQKEFLRLKQNPDNPLLLNRIGSIYLAHNKIEKARRYFQKALQQKTDYLEAARNLAHAYMAEGKPDKADSVLNLVLDDTNSSVILHESAIIKLIIGKFKDALNALDRVDRAQANYFEVVNTKGLICLVQKNFRDSEHYFKESIKLNPNYPSAHNNLAVVYRAQGQLDSAIKSFEKAIALDPNYVEAYSNLFQSYVEKEDLHEASKAIEKAQFLAIFEPELAFKHAWVAMTLGQYNDAINKYHKFLSLQPRNGNALNNIGFCYGQLGKYEEALSAYEQACKYIKENHLPHRNLMNLLTELGDHKKALNIAVQLQKIYSNDAVVLTSMGAAYASQERWDEARELLERAYKQKPPLTHLYVLLGFLYADIQPNYEKGKEALNYPLQNNFSKLEDVLNNLIHLHLVNENIGEAEKLIDRLDTSMPINLATYALYLLKSKRPEAAIEAFDQAIKLASSDNLKDNIKQRKYFDLANYYVHLEDMNHALVNFEKVLNVKNGNNYISKQTLQLISELQSNKE